MAFVIVLMGILTFLGVILQKTYRHTPLLELKRRARKGDKMAEALYKAAVHTVSLDILLWLIIGASATGFALLLSRMVIPLLAYFGTFSLLLFAFGWSTKARPGNLSYKLAEAVATPLSKVLNKIAPLFELITGLIQKHRPITVHTGLFEKDDLIDLIESQKIAKYNRIDQAELNIAKHALTFGNKLVREIMTPKRMVRFVKQADSIGPMLLNEIHSSGHSRFPVVGDTPDKIIGTLYIRDLLEKPLDTPGLVKDFTTKKVYYVQEEQDLWHALDAFLKTKHHLFIVVNNFEEIVGVLSIEDILEQIIGERIVDEFDRYDDLRAVAQLEAARDRHQKAKTVVK